MQKAKIPDKESLMRLNAAAKYLLEHKYNQLGYPFNQNTGMDKFHDWISQTGLGKITLINVGDPYKADWDMLNSDEFERESIDFMARHYGFENNHWGVLSNGGTDGNMHGIYFGRKFLKAKCGCEPILYVSKEAHYSLQKIGDIQNIETRIIDTLEMGQMDTEDLKRKMSSKSPALVAVAIGGTFKGAIDDQSAISDAIAQVNPPAVYKHLDAALFGGYLPFLKDETARHIVDAKKSGFDSVAVSGHKFLSMNEPIGIFICRKEILGSVNENPVEYLNGTIPTLNCSRSGFDALKLFWRIKSLGEKGLREEAEHTLAMAELFYKTLKSAGVECWRNPYSDTIIFRRPRREIIKKYALACGSDKRLGELSHIVVMQYFTPELIDSIVSDLLG